MVNGGKSPRKEVLNVLDNYDDYSGLIVDEWKLVNGSVKKFNGAFDLYLGNVEELSTPSNYASSILSSIVEKTLGSYKKEKLTARKILKLRKDATIKCNEAKNPLNDCNVLIKPCLFNIIKDPCERRNLADVYPKVLKNMLKRLSDHLNAAIPSRRTFVSDRNCDPNLHNGTWNSWIADNAF